MNFVSFRFDDLFLTFVCLQFVGHSDPKCFTDGNTWCSLNLEAQPRHLVVILVTDNGHPAESAYFDLLIELTDVNDKPSGIRLEPEGIWEDITPGLSNRKQIGKISHNKDDDENYDDDDNYNDDDDEDPTDTTTTTATNTTTTATEMTTQTTTMKTTTHNNDSDDDDDDDTTTTKTAQKTTTDSSFIAKT